MTIAAATGATESKACSVCGTEVEHREHATSVDRCEHIWLRGGHAAPCGLPCMGGGVKPAQIRGEGVHGYQNRCPRCGPLRVLPEVAQEMRQKATAAQAYAGTDNGGVASAMRGLSADVLRCLDEIAKLTLERDELQQALDEAHEQATATDMELADAKLVEHDRAHDVGVLINAAAQASARRVDAEAALARCPDRPERIAERLRLVAAVETAKDLESDAQYALAGAELQREQDAARARCAADGHMPEWLSCDYWSRDCEYRCTRCGDALQEPDEEAS